jgi:hypothetical protein
VVTLSVGVRWALYLLGNLWTLPNSLLGLLVAVVLVWGWPRFERKHRMWVCATGRGISGWVRRQRRVATTFGFVVLVWYSLAAESCVS